ncbi:MAG: serine/threonine protein kinase, partial [Kiritimatiellae bacterium]|nr:serine/threonine protein kinase [Kiritimatiellia bacterium]
MTTPDRTVPPTIPGLTFERPVGVGGTSVVWLARQTALDRAVAVKVLDPDRLSDPAERARFNAEARAAVRLASPAIVQILDYGEAPDGRLYYVMEYVEGGSLADWLRDNPHMPPRAVWQVLRVVASTLDAAFAQASIIHADIKPGNILLAADGTIRLADLGLASLADARSAPPSDVVEGTPTYFAPEQLEGAPASPQSDMYSLGLTAYHLLTGRPPFEGLPTPAAVLEAQRSDYLPDPTPLAPGLTTAGA